MLAVKMKTGYHSSMDIARLRRIAICLALICASARVGAVDFTNARIFVDPINGNDSSCAPQPVVKGQNFNLINPPTIACKTIQHACDIGVGVPMVHVAPVAGYYEENFVCRIAGTDPGRAVFFHIAEQVEPKGAVWMIGKPGSGLAIGEFTGSFVRAGGDGMHFDGGDNDGVYVHGADAAHKSIDFEFYYGTAVTHNRGRGIRVSFTDKFLLKGGAVFNNGGDCVAIENSTNWVIYAEAIFRCGSVTGSPSMPTVGTNVFNGPNGKYKDNKGNRESSPTIRLVGSPYAQVIGNHQPLPQFPPFSYDVSPLSDLATDVFSGN